MSPLLLRFGNSRKSDYFSYFKWHSHLHLPFPLPLIALAWPGLALSECVVKRDEKSNRINTDLYLPGQNQMLIMISLLFFPSPCHMRMFFFLIFCWRPDDGRPIFCFLLRLATNPASFK